MGLRLLCGIIVIIGSVSFSQASHKNSKLRLDQKIVAAFLAGTKSLDVDFSQKSLKIDQQHVTPAFKGTDFDMLDIGTKEYNNQSSVGSNEITIKDLDPKKLPQKALCRRRVDLAAMIGQGSEE